MATYDDDIVLNAGLNAEDVQDTAERLGEQIEDIFNQASASGKLSKEFKNLQTDMEDARSRSEELLDKLYELENSELPTQQYDELVAKL